MKDKSNLKKRVITSIIVLFLVLLIIDFISGIVLGKLYNSSKSGIVYQENHIINKTHEEVLIFGSSRSAFHYVPDIIGKELNMTVYNCGREGVGIYFHYAVLLATLNRYKPKLLILDLDFRDFYMRGGDFGADGLKELSPFYNEINPEFDSLIVRKWNEPLLYKSNLYKYNGKVFSLITGNLIKNRDNFNGYRPLKGVWNKKIYKKIEKEEFIEDEDLKKNVVAFINKAKENGVKIIISLSPSHKKIPKEFSNYVNEISNKYNVPVLNHFYDEKYLSNETIFHDEEHFNEKGAILFSKNLALEIKTTYNEF